MVRDKELEELAHPEYWDKRYTSEQKTSPNGTPQTLESYEWFRTFDNLRPFLTRHLPAPSTGCHVLHLGCGNSTLTSDLHGLGYSNQTSVDFSEVVIDAMKVKYAALNTRWSIMDIRNLELPEKSIDVAIDKSTLDVMFHGSLWDPPDDVRENISKYVDEVARVLKPGGMWLYITYRQPHFMKPLLTREDLWRLSVEVLDADVPGSFDYFGFVMIRKSD